MEQRKESFDRLGKNFQEKLCQLMLEDRPFCDQIEEVLNVNFFEKAYLRAFSKIIIDYREQYKLHPTYDLLAMKIKGDLGDVDKVVEREEKL